MHRRRACNRLHGDGRSAGRGRSPTWSRRKRRQGDGFVGDRGGGARQGDESGELRSPCADALAAATFVDRVALNWG